MNSLLKNPAFVVYAITCLVLCANLYFLWVYSGAKRGKTRTTMNEEDAARWGGSVTEIEAPPVARILRAHANAQAAICPFLFLALVFVLAGGSEGATLVYCGVFTVARLLHSVAYLKAKQPWRVIFFTVGGLVSIALLVNIAWMLVRASASA